MQRAVRYGAYSRSAIERILAVTATPKTTLDRLAENEHQQLRRWLDDRPVQPRSGKDYQELLDRPPPQTTEHKCEPTEHKPTEDKPTESDDREPGPSSTGPSSADPEAS
jgi:hypothetical protein